MAYFVPSIGETSIEWVLDGQVVSASASSPACSAGGTGPALSVGSTSAVISGVVDSLGPSATYHFEWGTSAATLASTPVQTVAASDPQLVSADLSGLTPGTTYVYELVADNGRVASTGAVQSFTTSAAAAGGGGVGAGTDGAGAGTGGAGAGTGGAGAGTGGSGAGTGGAGTGGAGDTTGDVVTLRTGARRRAQR